MNSERDLIGCDKSLPHTFLAHRIGESERWKMCFSVPIGGKKNYGAGIPYPQNTALGSASETGPQSYPLAENKILRISYWIRIQG